MSSPTGIKSQKSLKPSGRSRGDRVWFAFRRCGAVIVEWSLIATSAWVPFAVGFSATHSDRDSMGVHQSLVPLNPILAQTENAIAQIFAIPKAKHSRRVLPITNALWWGAIVAPVLVASLQLYLLGKTGKTLGKAIFRLQVVTTSGMPPGLARALIREGVMRWGLTLGSAYGIWVYIGAVPDLSILGAITGILVLADGICAWIDPQNRSVHDFFARTKVQESTGRVKFTAPVRSQPVKWPTRTFVNSSTDLGEWENSHRHPRKNAMAGSDLFKSAIASVAIIAITVAGVQIYVQQQTNWRQRQQLEQQRLSALMNQFAPDSRQGAILALGSLNQPDAPLQWLTDQLGLETNPNISEAIAQALITAGPKALPYLRRLNQALKNDLDALQIAGTPEQIAQISRRQQVTQRAIAKIILIYAGQIHPFDLSHLDLSQRLGNAAPFTLVLTQTDLAGIQLRWASLNAANFQGSRFFGPGEDERFNTFDDLIADLRAAQLQGANFSAAFLNRAWLERANLAGANFNHANLSQANLTHATLNNAQILKADLSQTILDQANLSGAYLGEVNAAWANLRAVNATQAKAAHGIFQNADLSASNWQGADLSGANLSHAKLQNANFSQTRLVSANLTQAQLQNVNFQGADLTKVNLRRANVDGADFQGATLGEVVSFARPKRFANQSHNEFTEPMPAVAVDGPYKGVDFSQAKNLDLKQIIYICTQAGLHPQCSQ